MIDKLRHFALTSLSTIHDEEAMTALELMGRIGAKLNEVVSVANQNEETMNAALAAIPESVERVFTELEENGTLSTILNKEVRDELLMDLEELDARIDALVASSEGGSTEVVDARGGYPILKSRLDAMQNGENMYKVVRPGSVRNDSIYTGMLGRDMTELRQNHFYNMAGKWNGGNAYVNAALETVEHSGYTLSDPIPVKYGQLWRIQSAVYGGEVSPVALYNYAGECIKVAGLKGTGEWILDINEVWIDDIDIAYLRIIVGNSYIAQARAEFYDFKPVNLNQVNLATNEHWHMHAKKRIDTITDRAQIKCWFKLPAYTADTMFNISFAMGKYWNVAEEGITLRLFAAVSDSTYDQQLPETAAGYKYLRSRALDVAFPIPTTIEAGNVTHLCLFVDIIPEDPEKYMDVWMLPPVLQMGNTNIKPSIPEVHGGVYGDYMNVVRAGATLSGAYQKKILGAGDSLMKGNTLHNRYSWFNIAAGALDMFHTNEAINGLPLATPVDGGSASVDMNINEYLYGDSYDYVIVQGGANDKRLNIPLSSFSAAVQSIIKKIRTVRPKAKILFATNWRRTTNANSLGLYDYDYVNAMKEECEIAGVPCVDNYADGLNLLNESVAAWADEGIVSLGTANIHFSKEGNRWIAERYITEIMKL